MSYSLLVTKTAIATVEIKIRRKTALASKVNFPETNMRAIAAQKNSPINAIQVKFEAVYFSRRTKFFSSIPLKME